MMPVVARLLFAFVLVCAAVMSSITRSHFARASPASVLGTDAVKASSYSPYNQDLPPSSGRQSSQLQNTNIFHSRQTGQDYKALHPEMAGPSNRLFVRQGKNLNQYPVVVLKSAPGHPLRQSSRNPEEEPRFEDAPRLDAPKIPAGSGGQSGGQSAWQSSSFLSLQPGRYLTGSRKYPRTSSGVRPGKFPLRRVTASEGKNTEVSVLKHGPQPEKLTSSLTNEEKVRSFVFKPSFVRREDFGKPLNSLSVSKMEKDERVQKHSRTASAKEDDDTVHVAQNAGRYQAPSRLYFPRHFAAQSHKDKLSVSAIGLVAMTTRKPVPRTSSRSMSKFGWPAPLAFANGSPSNKGKSYTFKMANVYPFLSSKYSFSPRKVEPQTTTASSTSEFQHPENLNRRLLRRPSNRVKGANTASRPSDKSAAQQNFGLDQSGSQLASTSPIPETPPPQRRHDILAFGNERNGTQAERRTPTGATADHVASEGAGPRLVQGKSRLFGGASTSSTVLGRRVHNVHRTGPKGVSGNSPIIRLTKRPESELVANAWTPHTPNASGFTKSGVRLSGTGLPVPTNEIASPDVHPDIDKDSKKLIQTDNKSSGSDVFDSGMYEEDLFELNYLRISTVNVSFKSI
ncbi:uncharacterized protein LOC144004185 [Festucalex cinctus]